MITIKEELLTHEKLVRAVAVAGYEALGVWLAIKGYCATKLTDGFIPERDLLALKLPRPLAAKALQKTIRALVECGDIDRDGNRGAGLLDLANNGYQMHDYLDHSNAREQVELSREKQRLKKQQQRDRARQELETIRTKLAGTPNPGTSGVPRGQAQGQDTGTPLETPPSDTEGTPQVRTHAPTRVHARAPAHPSPAQPSPSLEDDGDSARDPDAFIECPVDLALTDGERANLQMGLAMTDEFIDRATPVLRAKFASMDPMTLGKWRRCLVSALTSEWGNPAKRDVLLGKAPSSGYRHRGSEPAFDPAERAQRLREAGL